MIWMFAGMAAQAIKSGMEAAHEEKMQKLQNESIRAYNKQVLTSSAKQLNEINIQRTVSRAQTGQALDGARRQATQESSERNLQSAASDTMGASVEQNLNDVDVQLSTVTSTLMQNQETQEEAFNSAVNRTTADAQNSIKDLLTGAGEATMSASLGSMVGTLGTSLAANKMQTGSFFNFERGSSTGSSAQQAALSSKLGLGG